MGFRISLEGREKVLGENHPNTLKTVLNLADLLRGAGRLVDAKALYMRALATKEATLGQNHMDCLNLGMVLADVLGEIGDRETNCKCEEGIWGSYQTLQKCS